MIVCQFVIEIVLYKGQKENNKLRHSLMGLDMIVDGRNTVLVKL